MIPYLLFVLCYAVTSYNNLLTSSVAAGERVQYNGNYAIHQRSLIRETYLGVPSGT